MKEADLYPPLKQFFEIKGYTVKGEIKNCDVVAVGKDEVPLIVELKLTLNLNLILQAVDRLALTPKVYIGVPKDCNVLAKNRKRLVKCLRMLGLGLIAIDIKTNSIKVIVEPGDYKPRESKTRKIRLLKEFEQRQGDPNKGGTAMSEGIVTAYRQQAIDIAHYLEANGASKASQIAKALKQPKARDILYNNVYGWFEKVGFGVYQLSPLGVETLKELSSKV